MRTHGALFVQQPPDGLAHLLADVGRAERAVKRGAQADHQCVHKVVGQQGLHAEVRALRDRLGHRVRRRRQLPRAQHAHQRRHAACGTLNTSAV